ncbi:MAG: four helix bundle protein [Thermodesulfobacteriota bacterium]
MSDYRTYKDLEVYQIAHRLGIMVHQFSLNLPKLELYETSSQLRRSSKSISANIVEVFCRRRL